MDLLAELIEAILSAFELPDAETLVGGRRSRFIVSLTTLTMAGGVWALPTSSAWLLPLIVIASLGAAWVGLLSVVDAIKSLPSGSWVTAGCLLASTATIVLAVRAAMA
jgi:hypothetical protein